MTFASSADYRLVFQARLASTTVSTRRAYMRSVDRLEHWSQREDRDVLELQPADLTRFLAEQAHDYSPATIRVCRSAIAAFYNALADAGVITANPAAERLLLVRAVHREPAVYLDAGSLASLRRAARELGPLHSLAICLLHETPASVTAIASLTITHLAEDRHGAPYAILGRTQASRVPWPISQQAREAAVSLAERGGKRLIAPFAKNPNVRLIRAAVEEARASAQVESADLVGALKGLHRRREQLRCNQIRLQPSQFLTYRRALVDEMTPLAL